MYCRNCGNQGNSGAVACTNCGLPPLLEKKFCPECGAKTHAQQVMCPKCGMSIPKTGNSQSDKKMAAGLLAIFLGGLGIHKFYLGYRKEGITTLIIFFVGGLCTCGVASGIIHTISFIEGIIYLSKPDNEFDQIYIQGDRGWF